MTRKNQHSARFYKWTLLFSKLKHPGLVLSNPGAGGGEGARQQMPTYRSNFFHFHAVFGKKSCQIIGFRPQLNCWRPLSRLGNSWSVADKGWSGLSGCKISHKGEGTLLKMRGVGQELFSVHFLWKYHAILRSCFRKKRTSKSIHLQFILYGQRSNRFSREDLEESVMKTSRIPVSIYS